MMHLSALLSNVSDEGILVVPFYFWHDSASQELKNSKVKLEKALKTQFASGYPFTSLFVSNAPLRLAKGFITSVEKPYAEKWLLTCDISKFFTPDGLTFKQVKTALAALVEKLQPYLKQAIKQNNRFGVQILNEVIAGKRTYSLSVIGLEPNSGSHLEIDSFIRNDPILHAIFLLAAKRLRTIGRWSWTWINEDELIGKDWQLLPNQA